jgi:hypothetical protein
MASSPSSSAPAIVVQKSFFHHRPSTALGNAPLRGYRVGKNFSGYLYQVKDPAGQAVVTKYYPGGAFRVGGVLYYSLTDHLGSTSITIDPSGNKTEMR